jgi:hypothetical protein
LKVVPPDQVDRGSASNNRAASTAALLRKETRPMHDHHEELKYYVVWIDLEGERHAGGSPWSKFVAACLCDSDHYRNPQAGLVREDRLYDWFRIDSPMSLTEDFRVRVKQRYITIANSAMEFNMRRQANGFMVFRKGPPHHEPVFFEDDSESTGATKAKAYIDEQLMMANPSRGLEIPHGPKTVREPRRAPSYPEKTTRANAG